MYKLAMITCREFPDLIPADQQLASLLTKYDIQVEAAVWNDPQMDWTRFDSLLIRSCWDYYLHPVEFGAWLDQLDQSNVEVWNPVSVLRENMHKFYLRDLELAGITSIPTLYMPKGTKLNLQQALDEQGWENALVKPAISAIAHHTYPIDAVNAEQNQELIDNLLGEYDLLIQKFLPQIKTAGEWSFFFFNGRFSHAVLKNAKSGDFRVQLQHGGRCHGQTPPPSLLEQAHKVVEKSGVDQLLYARVDGVEVDGQLYLMELELIEPDLFFQFHPDGLNNFIAALLERVGQEA